MRRKNYLGRFLALLLTFAMTLPMVACVQQDPPEPTDPTQPPQQLVVPEGYSHVTVGELAGVNIYGTSVEFDPHFFSANVQRGVFKRKRQYGGFRFRKRRENSFNGSLR